MMSMRWPRGLVDKVSQLSEGVLLRTEEGERDEKLFFTLW